MVSSKSFGRLKSKKAIRKGNSHFSLRWLDDPRISEKRLGIVIAAKVGTAVKRNLIKRIIRETFRRHREKFPQADLVVICNLSLKNLGRVEIRRSFETLVDSIS